MNRRGFLRSAVAVVAAGSLPIGMTPAAQVLDELEVLDLFAGIGGFSLGLERAGGFRTAAFCERSGHACRLLRKHWPTVPIFEDVETLTAARLRDHGIRPRVITGGFPCQDLSTAGKGAGLAGERSGLWSEFARLIREVQPDYAIVENVSALLGRGIDTVLGDLAQVGYDAVWHCLPASALGAPHRRDRVWIVAYPGGGQRDRLVVDLPAGRPDLGGRGEPGGPIGWNGLRYERTPAWYRDGSPAPRICRMDDGLPHRVDRVERLGNAVVPQITELIGRAINAHRRSALSVMSPDDPC